MTMAKSTFDAPLPHTASGRASSWAQGRKMLLWMLVFFTLPLMVVAAMYALDWHPAGRSHGTLVSPLKPLPPPDGIRDMRDAPVPASLWRDKWSMVYIADQCRETCEERLHLMRQIQVSMDKNMSRVQRILISSDPQLQAVQARYPDLIILHASSADVQAYAQHFQTSGSPHEAREGNTIYLADPLANLMMYFPSSLAPGDIRTDIARLLNYAWAG
jgi:cytochrome oxidase Cu insertion factor (SCO1/SenC/PrrC family)